MDASLHEQIVTTQQDALPQPQHATFRLAPTYLLSSLITTVVTQCCFASGLLAALVLCTANRRPHHLAAIAFFLFTCHRRSLVLGV